MNPNRPFLGPFALFLIVAGGVETTQNISQRLERRDMQAHGLDADARIVNKFVSQRLKKEDPAYWLSVKFVTQNGFPVDRNIQVTKASFDTQPAPANTTVRYLGDPPTAMIIEGSNVPPGSLFGRLVVLCVGVVAGGVWLWRRAKASLPINTPATS